MPKNILYSIDQTERNQDMVVKVNALVQKYNLENKVVWGSKYKEQHNAVAEINPNVSMFYSGSNASYTYLCWLCGCLFCCPLRGDAFMTTHVTQAQQSRLK